MKHIQSALALVLAIALLFTLAACGGQPDPNVGKYLCVGESYYDGELGEPYQESWLELKAGGKGTYYSGSEFDLTWKIDGTTFTGTVSFLGISDTMNGTIVDGVIDVKYGDMNIRFVREGVSAPTDGTSGGDAGTGGEDTGSSVSTEGINDNVTLAGSLFEAFSVTPPTDGFGYGDPDDGEDDGYGDGGFVSPTTSISFPSSWYGSMSLIDKVGMEEYEDFSSVYGLVGTTDGGRPYFEIYLVEDGTVTDKILFSMWVFEDDTTILPDIGDEDAWLLDMYLTADDTETYTVTLNNGAISFFGNCVCESGSAGVSFFLRETGTYWDEVNDPLPPDYDEYANSL